MKRIIITVVIGSCLLVSCGLEGATPTAIPPETDLMSESVESVASSTLLAVSSQTEKKEQELSWIAPVESNSFQLSDTMSIEGDPNTRTTTLSAEKAVMVQGEKRLLEPIQTDTGDLTGYRYDHFKDDYGNIYKFYEGTDIFAEYQKKVDHIALGNREVPSAAALAVCQSFLDTMGYDVTGFEVEHSNDYCYDFKAIYAFKYRGFQTNEKLVLHLMAGEDGNVYLTSFRATDYGRFSQDERMLNQELDLDTLQMNLKDQLQTEYPDEEYSVSTVLWKDAEDVFCLRSMVFTGKGAKTIYTYQTQ